MNIGLGCRVDPCQVETIGPGQGLGVNLRAPTDERLLFPVLSGHPEGLIERVSNLTARGFIIGIAGQDIHLAAGQGLANALVGLAANDEMMPHGQSLETLEIIGKMPGQAIIHADAAVLVHGHDDGDEHFLLRGTHTEMGALMWEWAR